MRFIVEVKHYSIISTEVLIMEALISKEVENEETREAHEDHLFILSKFTSDSAWSCPHLISSELMG